jgi:HipA-like C-terminal domain
MAARTSSAAFQRSASCVISSARIGGAHGYTARRRRPARGRDARERAREPAALHRRLRCVSEKPFPVIDVSAWEVVRDETSGAEEKAWLREHATGQDWLFKAVTIKNGHVHGEDWAEKAAAHLADLIGVPCARVEMARRDLSRGSISLNLAPELYDLQDGRLLLELCEAPGYTYQPRRGGGHPGHTLENILSALGSVLPPPGWANTFNATAFDVFAGFMMLDAWIANTDRHEKNWSVLLPSTQVGSLCLCGSYDHASSLGFNVPDQKRAWRLATPDRVQQWCEKGVASCFEHTLGQPIPTLVDMAKKALDLASTAARQHWPQMLAQVTIGDVQRVLDGVPEMSVAARTFAVSVLDVNRRRVLDACT